VVEYNVKGEKANSSGSLSIPRGASVTYYSKANYGTQKTTEYGQKLDTEKGNMVLIKYEGNYLYVDRNKLGTAKP
jgi:hypothetical protein